MIDAVRPRLPMRRETVVLDDDWSSFLAPAEVIGIPSDRYGEEVMAWVKPPTARPSRPSASRPRAAAGWPASRSRATGRSSTPSR
jgi:hypothetical protein